MTKFTMQERLAAGCAAMGYRRATEARTTKWTVFEKTPGVFYYVGKGGSLRIGGNATNNVPVSERRKEEILAAGNAALAAGAKVEGLPQRRNPYRTGPARLKKLLTFR
jgi:hypothetical protein